MPEPLERKRDRRAEERRESFRKATALVVREGQGRHETTGELGLGGASFTLPAAPRAELIIELTVPSATLSLPARLRTSTATKGGHEVHVTFAELDVATELAVAKWLDEA